MLTPYGLDIIESCLSCKMRAEHLLCDLPPDALQAFESIKFATAYPKGAVRSSRVSRHGEFSSCVRGG